MLKSLIGNLLHWVSVLTGQSVCGQFVRCHMLASSIPHSLLSTLEQEKAILGFQHV